MAMLHSVQLNVNNIIKEISVYCDDVTMFSEPIDILTTSAYVRSYAPTPRTVFCALYEKGINAEALACEPEIDLRNPCRVWLSKEIVEGEADIGRIGCIELVGRHFVGMNIFEQEHAMLNSICAYFHMLDIARLYGVKMDTIALPLLGSGSQRVSSKMMLIPLINECLSFLRRNPDVKRILFIEKNYEKAQLISESLQKSLQLANNDNTQEEKPYKQDKLVFISYSTLDKNVADNLCFKLESKGIKVWYAPRDVHGPYAKAIFDGIERATHFAVILSKNSLGSEHVLNEVDLAFQKLPNNIKFRPFRIDDAMFTPEFRYYLSRQHWMDATNPPLEERLNEFVNSLLDEDV